MQWSNFQANEKSIIVDSAITRVLFKLDSTAWNHSKEEKLIILSIYISVCISINSSENKEKIAVWKKKKFVKFSRYYT